MWHGRSEEVVHRSCLASSSCGAEAEQIEMGIVGGRAPSGLGGKKNEMTFRKC